MALSIASTGLSLGGVVITPISATLMGQIGITKAAPILAIMYVVGVVPLAWLLLRPNPSSLGIVPPAQYSAAKVRQTVDVAAGGEKSQVVTDGIRFREAVRAKFFWCFSGAYVFLMLAQVGGIAHQYGLARETLTESQTALAVAILPVASIIGRLIGGWTVEQVSMRAFAIVVMMTQVVALSALAFGNGVIALCVGLALFGTTVGNLLMLQPLLVSEAFGIRDYARIFSVSNLLTSWGTAAGPWILGLVYGLSDKHYGGAYLVAACAGMVGLFLFISGGKVQQ